MNPIYKFELTANGTTQRAFPIYKDDLAKDFEKESGQEFFRAKLSGNLTFESDDYTFIVSKAFDTQFVLEIFISYNAGQTWTSYWRGTFWKTDCEFDGDEQTVKVKPTVWDQYNDVLAGMDKEYNLIELTPEIMPVKADKRPMIQVYVPGQTVIGCFLSGMWWEQECEAESDTEKLTEVGDGKLNFALNRYLCIAEITQTGTPQLPQYLTGELNGDTPYPLMRENYGFDVEFVSVQAGWRYFIYRISDNVRLWQHIQTGIITRPFTMTLDPIDGSGATGTVELYVHELRVYARYICDVETALSLSTFEIGPDDIVINNRNYKRVIAYNFPDTIGLSSDFSTTPTKWGLYEPGLYYQTPNSFLVSEWFPVARSAWGRFSIWFTFSSFDWIVEESARQPFTIRHAYPLWSVLSVLLAKVAPGITHAGTTDYSQFLYGTNLIGITQTLLITPKSNIVSAGYDQPAQKAPITLKNVLDMLRDCFRCYWFIDSNNRFRVEHIEFFRRGGSYSYNPVVGVDLTTEKVTRNGKPWAFARDQYKFDKPEMAARYQFGWMDDVTQLFDGFPIDIISKYVNPDNIEQIDVSKFTSDIDYILLNPGEISKDGFVLLSATDGGNLVTQYGIESGKYIATNGAIATAAAPNFGVSDYIPALSMGIISNAYASGSPIASFNVYDENKTLIRTVLAQSTYIYQSGDAYVRFCFQNYSSAEARYNGYVLPYMNWEIDGQDHYLQNAFVAFCMLQRYYAYDMPAYRYEINGQQMYAMGIKKLKNQSLKFPMLTDPDLLQLVKTTLGNGMIQKLSVNLSSRNANATLKYDTE